MPLAIDCGLFCCRMYVMWASIVWIKNNNNLYNNGSYNAHAVARCPTQCLFQMGLELRRSTTFWRQPWWSFASSDSGNGSGLGAFRGLQTWFFQNPISKRLVGFPLLLLFFRSFSILFLFVCFLFICRPIEDINPQNLRQSSKLRKHLAGRHHLTPESNSISPLDAALKSINGGLL